MEDFSKLDHDAIMLEARMLRAETLRQIGFALVSWFRRKPGHKAVHI